MCKIAEIIRKFQDEERRCNLKEILAELEININKHIEKIREKINLLFFMDWTYINNLEESIKIIIKKHLKNIIDIVLDTFYYKLLTLEDESYEDTYIEFKERSILNYNKLKEYLKRLPVNIIFINTLKYLSFELNISEELTIYMEMLKERNYVKSELSKCSLYLYGTDKHFDFIMRDIELIKLVLITDKKTNEANCIKSELRQLSREFLSKLINGGYMNINYLDITTEDDTYDFIFTNYEDEYKISIELLYKYITTEFKRFLYDLDQGDIYTENGIPCRMSRSYCFLTFDWCRKREEIIKYIEEFSELYLRLISIKEEYKSVIRNLFEYISITYFVDIPLTKLIEDIKTDIPNKLKKILLDDICSTPMHKVCMYLLVEDKYSNNIRILERVIC